VLQNLLANAWKYTSKRAQARVEFGVEMRDGERVYYVRDNGAGFDMQHSAGLFKPFQRLHTDREYEGTGIGLATVERIIRRHSGRIWADAAPDGGATFSFVLPE
jgi:light-regulated signal transduction histidine kinase (bacteriophytochrome)